MANVSGDGTSSRTSSVLRSAFAIRAKLPSCAGTRAARARRPTGEVLAERDGALPLLPPWRCEVCRRRFEQAEQRGRHYCLEHGERPFACPAASCAAAGMTEPELQQHVEEQHPGLRLFVCETCGADFESARALHWHADRHSRLLRCPDAACGRLHGSRAEHVDHVERHMGLVSLARLHELADGVLGLAGLAGPKPGTGAPPSPFLTVEESERDVGPSEAPVQAVPVALSVKSAEAVAASPSDKPAGAAVQQAKQATSVGGKAQAKHVDATVQANYAKSARTKAQAKLAKIRPKGTATGRPGRIELPELSKVKVMNPTRAQSGVQSKKSVKATAAVRPNQAEEAAAPRESVVVFAVLDSHDEDVAEVSASVIARPTSQHGEFEVLSQRLVGVENMQDSEKRRRKRASRSAQPVPTSLGAKIRQAYYDQVGTQTSES